jgi:hypothetical protein
VEFGENFVTVTSNTLAFLLSIIKRIAFTDYFYILMHCMFEPASYYIYIYIYIYNTHIYIYIYRRVNVMIKSGIITFLIQKLQIYIRFSW